MQLRYWNLLDPNCIGSNRIINTDSFPYQTSMKKKALRIYAHADTYAVFVGVALFSANALSC